MRPAADGYRWLPVSREGETMTERPEELVDDLIDETRGPEEDAPADSTTDDAAVDIQSGAETGKDGVPVTPEPPD
jgi:hypothetical protein